MKKTYVAVDVHSNKLVFSTGLSLSAYCNRKGLDLVVVYDATDNVSIATKHDTWTGYGHGVFGDYIADYRIGKTNEVCISKILLEAGKLN